MTRREISKWDRMVEIVNSMPEPEVILRGTISPTPMLQIVAKNRDGICVYRYIASGTMSVCLIKERLNELNIKELYDGTE